MRVRAACTLLAVLATVASGVAPAPPTGRATATTAGSALERRYPLGSQPLCCSAPASPTPAASPISSGSDSRLQPPAQDGSRRLLRPLVLLLVLLALVWGWTAWRFAWRDGHLERKRARRRWVVGRATYRLAQSLGFRHSASRDALVPGLFGGAFGPVLRLRRAHGPALAGSVAPPLSTLTGSEPPAAAADPRGRTIDVACLPLPHAHRDATLWQLTAADVGSQFAWAELVRRRGGPPAALHVAAFVRRIAAALAASGRRLDTIVMHPEAGPAAPFHDAVLPPGVRLVRLRTSGADASIAAELHHLLVARHWRSAYKPPEAPPFDELQRQLQGWTAARNAERTDPRRVGEPRPVQQDSRR